MISFPNRTRKQIEEWLEERFPDEEIVLADDLDEAFIGIGQQCSKPPLAVYDLDRVMGILMDRDGMSCHEAREFIDFNITGAWVGERTPIFLDPME